MKSPEGLIHYLSAILIFWVKRCYFCIHIVSNERRPIVSKLYTSSLLDARLSPGTARSCDRRQICAENFHALGGDILL